MNTVRNALIGLAVADAIGVPVEFRTREELTKDPVVDIREYGTYNQPKGTWSDDSSLTFCLADSLCNGYSLLDIAVQFIAWKRQAVWTPHNAVFDIGIQTSSAINILIDIVAKGDVDALKYLKYGADEYTNGNGSLMRILPLYFYLEGKGIEENFATIWEVSALTHGHVRSAIACLIYLIMADEIIDGQPLQIAYQNTQRRVKQFFIQENIDQQEVDLFDRLIKNNIAELPVNAIESGGYVMHTIEASFWCLLNNKDYKSTILAAVNLGQDTDTTAAVVGGLAGLFYGVDEIPEHWLNSLVRLKDIEQLCDRLAAKQLNN